MFFVDFLKQGVCEHWWFCSEGEKNQPASDDAHIDRLTRVGEAILLVLHFVPHCMFRFVSTRAASPQFFRRRTSILQFLSFRFFLLCA